MYAQILEYVSVFCMLLAFLIAVFSTTFSILSLEKNSNENQRKED